MQRRIYCFEDGPNDIETPVLGTISGSVTELTPDGEEAGIGGVTIRLEDPEGDVVATTATDGSGDYFFENVLPGNYILVEEQPDGFVSVSDFDRSTDDENDPDGGDDGTAPNNEIPVTLLDQARTTLAMISLRVDLEGFLEA